MAAAIPLIPVSPAAALSAKRFAPPAGPPIRAVGHVGWLDPATLVILGQNLFIGARCRSCAVDTATAGRMLYTLPAAGGTPVPVPGTDYATSVAVRVALAPLAVIVQVPGVRWP